MLELSKFTEKQLLEELQRRFDSFTVEVGNEPLEVDQIKLISENRTLKEAFRLIMSFLSWELATARDKRGFKMAELRGIFILEWGQGPSLATFHKTYREWIESANRRGRPDQGDEIFISREDAEDFLKYLSLSYGQNRNKKRGRPPKKKVDTCNN